MFGKFKNSVLFKNILKTKLKIFSRHPKGGAPQFPPPHLKLGGTCPPTLMDGPRLHKVSSQDSLKELIKNKSFLILEFLISESIIYL